VNFLSDKQVKRIEKKNGDKLKRPVGTKNDWILFGGGIKTGLEKLLRNGG